jgi:serine protease Do
VHLVATTQRSAFNIAAQTIRPSVVGIRATFSRPDGTPTKIRVGSGVLVDSAGYVVTCYHVIADATRISVSPFNQATAPINAQFIASQDDLALLRLESGAPFPAAQFGDSGLAEVGDWVLAVGHPFGLGLTVTAGIIGRRRGVLDVPGGGQYTGLFQTDAPINEGSSGGPLVDLQGRVVGLNTAIYSPTGAFSGAGFAIPSNRVREFLTVNLPNPSGTPGLEAQTAQPVAGQLPPGLNPANTVDGWGMRLSNLSSAIASHLSYPFGQGVVVTELGPLSPAAQSKLARWDIITSIGGQPVNDVGSVARS